jgi:HAD superfamily hydrolase (TIGR01459 family)
MNAHETIATQASRPTGQPCFVDGVGAFAYRYEAFVVDQWGVLHDGQAVFSGAVECLRRLLVLGKQVVILSNSGRQAADNALRLRAMGIGADCYTALITSGEVARKSLAARTHPFPPSLGRRCLLLNSDGTDSLVRGLDIEVARTIAEADFILLAGVADDKPLAFYLTILEYGSSHGLPLICGNPDLVRFSPQGLTFSAGELARRYEQMGGTVHYIGKPHEAIYRYCAEAVSGFDPGQAVAIGDSVSHDVVGGARAGLATALVTGGIHQADFADAVDDADRLRRVAAIVREHGIWPDWVIPRFVW